MDRDLLPRSPPFSPIPLIRGTRGRCGFGSEEWPFVSPARTHPETRSASALRPGSGCAPGWDRGRSPVLPGRIGIAASRTPPTTAHRTAQRPACGPAGTDPSASEPSPTEPGRKRFPCARLAGGATGILEPGWEVRLRGLQSLMVRRSGRQRGANICLDPLCPSRAETGD
jgi:hypothetical protein